MEPETRDLPGQELALGDRASGGPDRWPRVHELVREFRRTGRLVGGWDFGSLDCSDSLGMVFALFVLLAIVVLGLILLATAVVDILGFVVAVAAAGAPVAWRRARDFAGSPYGWRLAMAVACLGTGALVGVWVLRRFL